MELMSATKSVITERDSSRLFLHTRIPTVDFSPFFCSASNPLLSAPVVTVVVEGGPDTLSAIQNDLRHNIPVVLIDVSSFLSSTDHRSSCVLVQGSGRVPNLLAKFLSRTEALISRINKDADVASWKQVIDIQSTQDIDK